MRKELNTETSYIRDAVSSNCNRSMIADLQKLYAESPRKRHRFCFHQNTEVELHDIIIAYDSSTYIPPNKHIGKSESLVVLEGEIDFFLFNENGKVYDYCRISSSDPSKPFYVRVPPNTWHGLRVVSQGPCLVKETISGPYSKSSLAWAEFAPDESDPQKGFEWYDRTMEICISEGFTEFSEDNLLQISDLVFVTTRQLVSITRSHLSRLKSIAESSPLKRARICCHTHHCDHLQEMMICLHRDVSIPNSVHIRKDESLVVLEGSGAYSFTDQMGDSQSELALGSFGHTDASASFFARINRYLQHKIRVHSEFLLIHEATTGPFSKIDTDYIDYGAI